MKPYTYVVLLKFSNGKTETVFADNVEEVVAAAVKVREKYPTLAIVDMDVDTIWDSPRVRHGEA